MFSPATLIEDLRRRGIADERVLAAIAEVDRARFVSKELADQAWDDKALPIGSEQTISQPYIVALMTEALAIGPDDIVLEVGTGSGYQAAVLARLCRAVISIERHEELSAQAGVVLAELGIDNVRLQVGDGSLGAPDDGPFARIVVTAGAPEVPVPLLDQLADGGRMVVPVGKEDGQELLVVKRAITGYSSTRLCDCRFVPLIGDAAWW